MALGKRCRGVQKDDLPQPIKVQVLGSIDCSAYLVVASHPSPSPASAVKNPPTGMSRTELGGETPGVMD